MNGYALSFMASPACASLEDSDLEGDLTEATESPITDQNGLNPNGWNLNGLHWNGRSSNGLNWNGLHTIGLDVSSSSSVTSNIQSWLRGEPNALAAMPYLVACAVPQGTTVRATVNGTAYSWPGAFGLAPTWRDSGTWEIPSFCSRFQREIEHEGEKTGRFSRNFASRLPAFM